MKKLSVRARLSSALAVLTTVVAVAALAVMAPQPAAAGPTTTTQTFSYTGTVQSFTVPAGVSVLTVTITGGQGGNGGGDATPAPELGGYVGVVSGTIPVTPGQVLTVGVGGGGATGASSRNSGTASAATGGTNPLGGYAGGTGGKAGSQGSSGFGGAGGAASVLRVGSTDIVAGGGGGNGGSGQFAPTRGRQTTSTYAGRTDSTATTGQNGTNANDICAATSCSNNDGGGGGAGGGGALGGAAGAVEFGAGTSNEWFGYGGSVGQNSIASFPGLDAFYQSHAGQNGQGGRIVISYTTGSPAAPTALTGVAGDSSAALTWTAPSDPGQSAVSGYLARYSSDGGNSWSGSVDLGTTGTAGTVAGLGNGTTYLFQVAAVNSAGTGVWSAPSAAITPLGPPSAPGIAAVSAQDGALRLTLSAPDEGAAVTGYDYRIDDGAWTGVASTSTQLTIPGLVNGTEYQVEVRAQSAVGPGAVSEPAHGTPQAVPGAPTIASVAAGSSTVTIAFTPGFTGGSAIQEYQYRLDGSGSWLSAGVTSPVTIGGLSAGTTYSVELRAVNGSGAGAASAPATVTTPGLPDAPVVTSIVPGDGSVSIAFTPGSTGGSPIDHFEVRTSSGGSWTPAGSTSPIVVSGLTNGTAYEASVRAVNAVGAGPASAGRAFTPATVPGAPSIVGDTIAGVDATLSAAFAAPASDGGAAITGYQYSTDGGATWLDRTDGGTTASPVVITRLSDGSDDVLVNGTTYYVELRAVNAIGSGTASAVAEGIARTSPSAPAITRITAAPSSLTVVFAPAANGGSAITGYQYSLDDGATWHGTGTLGTTFAIGGLENGREYSVRMRATNEIGDGPASDAVDATPVGLPGRTVIDSVVRSNQTLTAQVSLADDGGSAVTAWEYSTDGGVTWAIASGTTGPLVLTTLSSDGASRLENGTGYALLVRAVTAVGTGPASATTTVAPATAPQAPAIAVTPGNRSAEVAFTYGTDGGSPVDGLEYSLDGSAWSTAGTLSSPFTITGLTNGTAYPIRVRAINAIGAGSPSVPASTTPRTVPGAPTAVAAGSNGASADVSWSAPADNGGAAITLYTASAYSSSTASSPVQSCTTTGTSCSITGLTNKTAYYVAVTATNAAGSGATSTPRVLVTPLARPSAPTISSLTAGDGALTAAFAAGAIGDGTFTGYQYSADGGITWSAASGASSPITIGGLSNGTSYSVKLRAVSTAGPGAPSAAASGTPYGYPGTPDPETIVANGGDRRITVSWAAPSLNGGILGDYTATAFSAQSSGSTSGTCTTATLTCTITGLVNGTTYWVSLQTRNSVDMYSQRSTPRVPATPSLTPGAPTGVQATAGDRSATLTWSAPTSTGASAISGYTVQCSAGGSYSTCADAVVDGTSAVVTGLTNGTAYTFKVIATNGSGSGPASTASAAVTPLASGVVPAFLTPVGTADGFTVDLANYDAAVSYAVTAGTGTATRSGATITVTGVPAGASSTVTVTASRSGYTTVEASVTGSALNTGTIPLFADVTATPDGFTFTISNYDAAATYAITADNGAAAVRDGDQVTVSGLELGGSSHVGVTASKSGFADATGVVLSTAMVAGTAPELDDLVATATGFVFQIADYDASLTYTVATTAGTATRSGATVTVTGLTDGADADVTVTATIPGVSTASTVLHGAALLAGSAPTVSAATRTVDGFTFDVDIADGSVVYTIATTAGTAVLQPGGTVLVTGLAPGASAEVTVTADQPGRVSGSTVVTAAALETGVEPELSAPTRTEDGFTVSLSNFDADSSYTVDASRGTATISGDLVQVTGLAPGEDAIVTVTAARDGSTVASSTATGSALDAGAAPVFDAVTATADGFTFTIANFDGTLDYSATSTPHAVVLIDGTGHGVVSGVAAGTAVTVTVRATLPGVSTASASTGATVLLPTAEPLLSAATPLAGGYRFEIVNFDAAVTYSFTQADGGSVVRAGSTVTVSGLGAAVTSATTVSATSAGHTVAVATADGTSFPNGPVPIVGAVTRTLDGFSFEFTVEAGATYTVVSDSGIATLSGATVTVTGLAAGGTTTVHLTATVPGSLDATSDISGTAIALGVAPVLKAAVSATGGFTVAIANYSALTGYRLASTAGTATRNGDTVTVSGLGAGASATLTVTAVRGGHRDASATRTGSAAMPHSVGGAGGGAGPDSGTHDSDGTGGTDGKDDSGTGGSGGADGSGTGGDVPAELQGVGSSAPGEGAVLSGGAPVGSQLSSSGDGVVLRTGNGLALTLAAWENGATVSPAADGVVEVLQGGTTQVQLSGFAAVSDIEIWGKSKLTLLASSRTDAAGALTQLVDLPFALAPGPHTLIVSGLDADGDPVTMQIGIRVLPLPEAAAPSTGIWWWWILVVALVLLGAVIWFAVARRRRHRWQD